MVEDREQALQEDITKPYEKIQEEIINLDISQEQELSASDNAVDEKDGHKSSQSLQEENIQQLHEEIADEEKEEDVVYVLKLQAVTKPHNNEICCLGVDEESLFLVSQGLDFKLFFFCLRETNFTPLGFYINNHLVDSFGWLNYESVSECNQNAKRLLIFCKHSYILEVDIPNKLSDATDGSLLSYCIDKFDWQVYKINGLLRYHELGDRISDINLDNMSDIGRDVLLNLKYKEKREKREAKEQQLGISGSLKPPKILCHLASKFPGRLWLSLSKNDSGYLFEFQFIKEYQDQPIEFTPCRAVEIITANNVPIMSMNFSFCGNYLYMALQDGTLHYCHLQDPFEPSSSYNYEKLNAPDPAISRVADIYVSPDGSLLTKCDVDNNKVQFKLNMVGHKDIFQYGALPSISSESSKDISKESISEDLPSLEEKLQYDLSKKYIQKQEDIIQKLEELKIRYLSLKQEQAAYLFECRSNLKYLETIPENLHLNTEVVSGCPKAVNFFKDKTKVLKEELDKEFERDLVKISLLKQKYLECFKSSIACEKIFVEESDLKLQSYRECIMPSFSENLPTKYQQVYGKKIDKKEDSQEPSSSKHHSNKKEKKSDKLKQRLTSTLKNIIEYPEDGPVSDIVLKYNKRKQELAERLKQRIATEEALENTIFDESIYKDTMEEIQKSLYKFKDTSGYDFVLPSIKCIYSQKKEELLSYLHMLHNFQELYNSYVTDVQKLKYSIHYPNISVRKEVFAPSGDPLDLKSIHISVVGDKSIKVEKRHIKIDWNSKGKQEPNKQEQCRKAIDLNRQWNEKMFKNFHQLIRAAKPKIDCEKKFMEMRFLMKCIELNIWKSSLSEEKLYFKILEELQNMLSIEENDLFLSEEEIVSLKNLRQQEKQNWMNLYHELIKIIGRTHKHKGYFKQIFKKKIYPNEGKQSKIRHSSSESSESEQNIDSDDDNQNIDLSVIDEELLRKVMELRVKRQEVDQKMKYFKRKIHSASVTQNGIKRKIQKMTDAKNEIYEKFDIILSSRKKKCDSLLWPLVLYPRNIHSDYICNSSDSSREKKEQVDREMSKIYDIVNEKLKTVNNYIRVSLEFLTTKVVAMEIQDMVDTASVLFSLVQSVSISTDEYFESLKHSESLDKLNCASEQEKEESLTFIEDILATVKDPLSPSETSLHSISQSESDASSRKTTSGKETTSPKKGSDELFNLEELKGDEDIQSKEKEKLCSWREVCNDTDLLGLVDKSHLQNQSIDDVVSSAIPQKACEKLLIGSSNDDVDYYRRPFIYYTIENMKKTCYLDPDDNSDSEIYIEQDTESNNNQNGSKTEYPTYPYGGLILNLSVLQDMEKSDLNLYPYTSFYQRIEFHEDLTVIPTAYHIEPARTVDMDILYDFTPVSLSDFILVNTIDINQILEFYSHLKSSSKELELELKLLQNKAVTTKRALSFKHQDLMKERRELYNAMKSTFNHVIDLDFLQDTIENPHLHIKKAEFQTELDSMKSKLKEFKESEALAQRSLDQLRLEDTKICRELLELRKEFKHLNDSYSKCQVLPRIGVITKLEEDSQSSLSEDM